MSSVNAVRHASGFQCVRRGVAVPAQRVMTEVQEMTHGLKIELDSLGIATLRLTEARQRNPLTRTILESLDDFLTARRTAWDEGRHDDGVRVIVLEAEGPVFSSGHSFDDFAGASTDQVRGTLELCAHVNMLLSAVPQPTIAAVAGSCLAGGAQLAASCDMVLAHRESGTFCLPGAKGGGYCHTPSVAVCSRVGAHKALELGLLGEVISAGEAERIGLANRAVDADEWRSTVDGIAEQLAATYNRNLAEGKLTLYEQARAPDLAARYEIATGTMVGMFGSQSFQAHMREFLSRRKKKSSLTV